ncbi:MAG: AAA family ATPase, partial [Cutibacterium acnes]|nr:AAA family ATPase [Cutibacterium acnes]
MKLHRIHVENFKAIDERTLELPDCGVVIATGRNEIGKTSMVEALDLLLDTSTKASSKSRKVRIAQPYGTSLQVVVEAEMTIGDHR